MYKDLVRRLRNCATGATACKTCDLKEDSSCSDILMKHAADAIEELMRRYEQFQHMPPSAQVFYGGARGWGKIHKAFYEGYEAGKKDAEYYALHCGDTDEPQTNADRIRAMSDEELAEWFCSVCAGDAQCSCSGCEFDGMICGFPEWLKQKYKDE